MSFADLYQEEYSNVFAYVLRRVENWHVAEDLTSAVFEHTLRRWEALAEHPTPRFYLLRAARYHIMNYRTRARRLYFRPFYVENPDSDPALFIDGGIDAMLEQCDTAMAAAFLRTLLAQCTAEELRIIELRYVRHLSAMDVAAQLGLTTAQYNKRHNHLMHRLGGVLGAPQPAPRPSCAVCPLPVRTRGLCEAHYLQWRAGHPHPIQPPKQSPTTCQACDKPHHCRGYCRAHYEAMRRHERMQQRQDAVRGVA